MMKVILLIHFSTCLLMTGIIWIIQMVHYPTFRFIKGQNFTSFSTFHVKSISTIVLPLMLIELMTATLLIVVSPNDFFYINLTLLVITWGVTFLVSMPIHKALLIRYDSLAIENLIKTNWLRTILWTIRCICLMVFITTSLGDL